MDGAVGVAAAEDEADRLSRRSSSRHNTTSNPNHSTPITPNSIPTPPTTAPHTLAVAARVAHHADAAAATAISVQAVERVATEGS